MAIYGCPALMSATHNRKVAIALAFAGALPTPLPLAWLHKFYLRQYLWGIVYLVLAPTFLPQVACCLEGVWYLTQSDDSFTSHFPEVGLPAALSDSATSSTDGSEVNSTDRTTAASLTVSSAASSTATAQVATQVANALRELEQLRQEGLITEYEFEQKRRKLLAQV